MGTWLQLSEHQAPGRAACKQCRDKALGHQRSMCNPPQRAQQREGRDWAAKPGGLDTLGNSTISRHIRGSQGTSGNLGDALTPSGSKELHLAPFHPITLCISQGTGSFPCWLSCQSCSGPSGTPHLCPPGSPGHVDEVCRPLRAPASSRCSEAAAAC